jgi:hypothetical protein
MARNLIDTVRSVRDGIAEDFFSFREGKIDDKKALVSSKLTYAFSNVARTEIAAVRDERIMKLAMVA